MTDRETPTITNANTVHITGSTPGAQGGKLEVDALVTRLVTRPVSGQVIGKSEGSSVIGSGDNQNKTEVRITGEIPAQTVIRTKPGLQTSF